MAAESLFESKTVRNDFYKIRNRSHPLLYRFAPTSIKNHRFDAFHSHLVPGAIAIAFDERDDPTRTVRGMRMDDATGNRYEARRLENGEHYEIVKNFIDEPRLRRALARHARNLQYDDLGRFWIATWEAT